MTTNNIPPRWYVIARDGIAMLCASEQDALAEVAKADQAWPDNAPHVAVQLVPVQSAMPADADDTRRLDWLREETCDLRCINVPTGGDDYEVRWNVIQHHMAKPHERVIGESFTDDPRDAIDDARSRLEGESNADS